MHRTFIRPLALAALLLIGGAMTAPRPAQAQRPQRPPVTQAMIVQTARRYLGYPYAWTGATPWTGFACIGLAHWVYRVNGIDVPDELNAAYAASPHVGRWSLRPGDLVFFVGTGGWWGLTHVEIYVGNGLMIGADNFQVGVRYDNLNDAYWSAHYAGANRPLWR